MARLSAAFLQMTESMARDSPQWLKLQMDYWRNQVRVWQGGMALLFGSPAGADESAPSNRQGDQNRWDHNHLFGFIKQSHLLTARWLQALFGNLHGIDPQARKRLELYTRQFVNALAPVNYPITNPEVIRVTLESGGANLLRGLKRLLDDLSRGGADLGLHGASPGIFRVGENLAGTPCRVVFQNDLIQLLQYASSTANVRRRPLLVVPSWLTKFYVLDLRPEVSLIRWWVDQGFTVFVISWVNPNQAVAKKGVDEYLLQGPLAALDAIAEATGETDVNAVGHHLGGTLLACLMGYLEARGDRRVRSATYLTTLLDFSHPGELEVFMDEEQITALSGPGSSAAPAKNLTPCMICVLLRANDLIWSYFVNSYLLDREVFPLDLLYWNADAPNVPPTLHDFYLCKLYQRNLLRTPDGIAVAGKSVNLGKVKAPAYFLSAVEDHIAPWESTFEGAALLAGPVRFALGAAGHVASVIDNGDHGRGYWTREGLAATATDWLETAQRRNGSWREDWLSWIEPHAGGEVPARAPGSGRLAILEDGPGSYVKA
jgi:polyhydroxyalkanoate synthase